MIDDELRRQNVSAKSIGREHYNKLALFFIQSSNIDFKLCLGATKDAGFARLWKVSEANDKLLDRKDELIANALLRFLSLRG
jgi:hypothetical protein